jgi:uncharacterized protein (DUF1786 family)
MKLLCVDIGSNTQDVLFLDSEQLAENAIQLVLPAPTIIIARKIQKATSRSETIFLTGDTMGGGACTSAVREHIGKGLRVYATPAAACSFSDDLEKVKSWGIELISPDEITDRQNKTVIHMSDIYIDALEKALAYYDVPLAPDVIAIAVLDHGVAPRGESERLFRFAYLEKTLRQNNNLDAFIFRGDEVPATFSRMRGIVNSIGDKASLLLMDTGASAVLGSSLDPVVANIESHLGINLGNSHTIAFNLSGTRILGMFEHHTSILSLSRLEYLIENLQSGKLQLDEVWKEGGHGSLIMEQRQAQSIVVTGPRRTMLAFSRFRPHMAAPFGNMMLSGCFGLAKAVSIKFPVWRSDIEQLLRN